MKKQKYLRVKMPNGELWDILASVIADDRARYYAKLDTDRSSGPLFDDAYDAEFVFTMEAEDELLEWASNNMNWKDVSKSATRVPIKPEKVNYQNGWINGEKEIILK